MRRGLQSSFVMSLGRCSAEAAFRAESGECGASAGATGATTRFIRLWPVCVYVRADRERGDIQ